MEIKKAIEICKERIDLDRKMRGNKAESDYEKFCERECEAIATLISACDKKGAKNWTT